MAKWLVRWIVKKYGIWQVLGWLEDYASDISTWGVDYWGRHGDD